MQAELEKIAHVYGDVCFRTKKQRRKRQKLLVTELLFDYAKNSTLHGLRYTVDRGLTTVEKLFWVITVIASLLLCSYYIYNVYQKWVTSPVIVTVNEKMSSVGTVPFPAVTICPQIRVKSSVYNFTEEKFKYLSYRLDERELSKFEHIGTVCEFYPYPTNLTNTTDVSLVNDLTEVAPSVYDMFFKCKWYNNNTYTYGSNTYTYCDEMFSKVYTEEGICYTTNTLAATDIFENTTQQEYQYLESNIPSKAWAMGTGYNYSEDVDYYPRRGRVLGPKPDMEILLFYDSKNRDEACNRLYSGYKIYLQHPADYPQSSLYFYAALPNQLSSLAVSFHEFNTDPNLKDYSPEKRQCYFPEDRKLHYFKIYTAKNCEAECLSNFTYAICGCVGFYMPHSVSNQLCTTYDKSCMEYAKDVMADIEISGNIRKFELKDNKQVLDWKDCSCLPACDTVEYDAEILKTEYRLQKAIKRDNADYFLHPDDSYSKIQLYFKKPQFVTMQRRELFGVTDFLANIGGLLGLFLGFSFLSLIEIIYFLTLRVGCILKKDLKEEKKKKKMADKKKFQSN